MKKVLICFSILFSAGIHCAENKNYSEENALLNTWTVSVKNKDYSLYKIVEAYPKASDQFLEMYRDYYPSKITVTNVENISDEFKDPDGKVFIKKTVTCAGEIIMRSDSKQVPFSGTFDLIRFKDSGKKWQIAGRTIIRSE